MKIGGRILGQKKKGNLDELLGREDIEKEGKLEIYELIHHF